MATVMKYMVYDNTSDINFRQWGKSIHDAFVSLGFVQTADAIVLTLTSVATGTGVYTGTITGGTSPAFVGMTITIAGFTNAANNGTFVCTASTTTTLTLNNSSSVSETHAATATAAQANWATISANTTASTFPAFEIWKSNDSLSTSLPVYFRIDYGENASATGGPAVKIQFGTGSNGTGTLTGTSLAAQTLLTSGAAGVGGSQMFASYFYSDGVGGRLAVVLWGDKTAVSASTNSGVAFGFERSKDASGNDTPLYFTWLAASPSVNWRQNSIFATSSVMGSGTPTTNIFGLGTFAAFSSLTVHKGVTLVPIYPVVGYLGNPLTIFMACRTADTNNNTPDKTSLLYNTSINYMSFTNINGKLTGSSTSSGSIAMRYE